MDNGFQVSALPLCAMPVPLRSPVPIQPDQYQEVLDHCQGFLWNGLAGVLVLDGAHLQRYKRLLRLVRPVHRPPLSALGPVASLLQPLVLVGHPLQRCCPDHH